MRSKDGKACLPCFACCPFEASERAAVFASAICVPFCNLRRYPSRSFPPEGRSADYRGRRRFSESSLRHRLLLQPDRRSRGCRTRARHSRPAWRSARRPGRRPAAMDVSPGKYLPVSESSGASALASTAGESARPGRTKVNPFPTGRISFGTTSGSSARRSVAGWARRSRRSGGDELHLAHPDPQLARVGLMVVRRFPARDGKLQQRDAARPEHLALERQHNLFQAGALDPRDALAPDPHFARAVRERLRRYIAAHPEPVFRLRADRQIVAGPRAGPALLRARDAAHSAPRSRPNQLPKSHSSSPSEPTFRSQCAGASPSSVRTSSFE